MPLYIWTVFLVVSAITQQLGHSAMCSSSLTRVSISTASSRYSLSSLRKSLHVSKGVVSLALEEAGQLLAQLQPGSQQPALHGRHGKAQRVGGFLRRELVYVPKLENGAVRRIETLDGRIEDFAELFTRIAVLGVL